MARNPDKLQERNLLIAQEYTQMYFVQGLRDEVIFPELADKWFLAENTVRKIVVKQSKKEKAT